MNVYTITGGTGKTGRNIALGLLEKGHKVRIVCRHPENAKELKEKGAELFSGDTRDESFLKKAFSGSDAIYALLPIDMQAADYTVNQVAHATAIRNAAVDAGVKYAVTLSSVGAHLDSGNGVVLGLHKMEELFNEVPEMNVKHLRAAYFMENTLRQIGAIRQKGVMAGPENGRIKFAMVAAQDISDVALKYLLYIDFSGKSVDEVLGQRDISYDEIAHIYGREIGIPGLKYIQLPEDEFISSMLKMGAGKSATGKFYEFTRLINEGKVSGFYTRTAANTTPTSVEDFTKVFKTKYEQYL